jgi:hypothetical protein
MTITSSGINSDNPQTIGQVESNFSENLPKRVKYFPWTQGLFSIGFLTEKFAAIKQIENSPQSIVSS